VIWAHPKYHQPEFGIADPPDMIGQTDMRAAGYTHGVYVRLRPEHATDMTETVWSNQANFKSERAARNYIAYMRGERMTK
jgi:hypothetical protein